MLQEFINQKIQQKYYKCINYRDFGEIIYGNEQFRPENLSNLTHESFIKIYQHFFEKIHVLNLMYFQNKVCFFLQE